MHSAQPHDYAAFMNQISKLLGTGVLFACGACSADRAPAVMCNPTSTGVVVVTATPTTAPVHVVTKEESGAPHNVAQHTGTFNIGDASGVVARRQTSIEDGELVGTAYNGEVTEDVACVFPIAVHYATDPASHRLWVTDDGNAQVLGIPEAALHASGTVSPDVVLGPLTNPGHPAFGPDGTLFLTDQNRVVGYFADTLAAGGNPDPDIVLTGPDIEGPGIPGPSALAFDDDETLWVGNQSGHTLKRFHVADILHSGEPTAWMTFESPSLSAVSAIAIQNGGGIWASNSDGDVFTFSISQFAEHVTDGAYNHVRGYTPLPVVAELAGPAWFVFDQHDNLWVAYSSQNRLVRYEHGEQTQVSGNTPAVQIQLPVDVILESAAFDASGGLWFTSRQGQLGRIAAEDLTGQVDANVSTAINVTGMGYASGLAFDPAPDNVQLAY